MAKKRTDQNRDYQRQYRERRRKEGYVPINIFIRKALRERIAQSGIPLEDFINDAIEERAQFIPCPATKMN
jgi:hypothetical protein